MFVSKLKFALQKFATPNYYKMPAAALDISDRSIKYMDIKKESSFFIPINYEKFSFSEGVIKAGEILNKEALIEELKKVRLKYKKYKFVNISLPEELAFVFTIKLKKLDILNSSVQQLIELKLPEFIPFDAQFAIFDFAFLRDFDSYQEYSVLVYPGAIVQEYIDAVQSAGFIVKFAELESISMARAVIPKNEYKNNKPILLLDVGNNKIAIAILINMIPLFTSTIKAPINDYFKKVYEEYKKNKNINDSGLDNWKFKKGLIYSDSQKIDEFSKNFITEIKKIINYYNKNNAEKYGFIEKIYLCGGNASVKGIESIITSKLNINTVKGNVWQNMFDLEEYVPQIDKQHSFMYATVAGLILKDGLC